MDTKSNSFGILQSGIIALTAGTAIIHLVLGIPNNFLMFILNGIGYLVLLAGLFLPQLKKWRVLIRWGLIAYTAVTVIAWILIGERSVIGYVDKAIEIALIVLLYIDSRK